MYDLYLFFVASQRDAQKYPEYIFSNWP